LREVDRERARTRVREKKLGRRRGEERLKRWR